MSFMDKFLKLLGMHDEEQEESENTMGEEEIAFEEIGLQRCLMSQE